MLTSLLELSNHARAAAAVGDGPTVAQAVSEVEARLLLPERALDGQLHGRKPVDCILNLALSGCDCSHLFATLCERAESEVRRWGRRRSCHSMTLAQLAERAAAAGCCASLGSTDVSAEAAAAAALYEALGEILTERGEPVYADTARALTSGTYSLVESHPAARWVFRASSRRGKEASASADGVAGADWGGAGLADAFADSSRPLTIDLGCGFGCGPLVYARSAWQGDNVLGCDLSSGGIGYARGVASRWDVSGRCRFVRDDARSVLRAAREQYPGGVGRVILSCPTPYARLQPSESVAASDGESLVSGNPQLPESADDPRFLGHAEVFDEIAESLAPGGELFLASNVEDVALSLLSNAEHHGFEALTQPPTGSSKQTRTSLVAGGATPTAPRELRRQQRWRAVSGARADGACWKAAQEPMPWASETERTHQFEGREVHRVVCRKL